MCSLAICQWVLHPPRADTADTAASPGRVGARHTPRGGQPRSLAIRLAPLRDLDLALAWRRAKLDRPDRCFVVHPDLVDWIDADTRAWLEQLAEKLGAGYRPHDAQPCFVPKAGGLVRPAAVLDVGDEVVYNALVGRCLPAILERVAAWQRDPDVAYALHPNPAAPAWTARGARVWRRHREQSLAALRDGALWVVFADVAGCYENIDLRMLSSDLLGSRAPRPETEALIQCLRRWSKPHGRGVPQGYSASDILAKLYLHPVDHGLRTAGFPHLRWVDDIRIFCRTRLEAKRALLRLTELLRARGLTIQSGKTAILPLEEARAKIDGVTPVIAAVRARLRDDLLASYGSAGGSGLTLADLRELADAHPDAPPPPVLEQTFRERFLGEGAQFDKTLLHYLLNRLGQVRSRVAVPYVLGLFGEHPEETREALRYLTAIDASAADCEAVLSYAASDEAVYDYQLYEIARWCYLQTYLPPALVHLCRSWAFDRNRAPWLRTYAFAVLRRGGDAADLERIEIHYPHAATELERADVVAAVARMEPGRRNTFYRAVTDDGALVARAAAHAERVAAAA